MNFTVPKYIEELKPYVAGKPIEEVEREFGLKRIVKLASNENPLGPSPKAVVAMRAGLKNLQLYPDASGFQLRTAIAKREGVTISEVVLGNGSNEVIELLFHALSAPGDQMVASAGVFVAYPVSAKIHGIETLFTPLTADYRFDLAAMLARIKSEPRVKWVALPNPNNPTGTYVREGELIQFLTEVEKIRGGTVQVVLDYAYHEYVTAKDLPEPMPLYRRFKNVCVLKTFSKIFGLGGLRVGYGIIHPELAAYVQKVRLPFNVSNLGLIGAEAALKDRAFLKRSIAANRVGLKQMMAAFDRMGVPYLPSQANFLLVNAKSGFKKSGVEVFELALRKGVILRPIANYGMPDWIRITIGSKSQNAFALKVLAGLV